MKYHEPSRILNETRLSFFGLGIRDFFGLISIYGLMQFVFGTFLEINPLIALGIIAVVFCSLIYIRNKFRRHIIRDFFDYSYCKIVRLGVWYDKIH